MTKPNSQTPETDAVQKEATFIFGKHNGLEWQYVDVEFARQLELQRNELLEIAKEMRLFVQHGRKVNAKFDVWLAKQKI